MLQGAPDICADTADRDPILAHTSFVECLIGVVKVEGNAQGWPQIELTEFQGPDDLAEYVFAYQAFYLSSQSKGGRRRHLEQPEEKSWEEAVKKLLPGLSESAYKMFCDLPKDATEIPGGSLRYSGLSSDVDEESRRKEENIRKQLSDVREQLLKLPATTLNRVSNVFGQDYISKMSVYVGDEGRWQLSLMRLDLLKEIFRVAYLASLTNEENRPTRFTISFSGQSVMSGTIASGLSRVKKFNRPFPRLSPEGLRKLAQGTDPMNILICVRPSDEDENNGRHAGVEIFGIRQIDEESRSYIPTDFQDELRWSLRGIYVSCTSRGVLEVSLGGTDSLYYSDGKYQGPLKRVAELRAGRVRALENAGLSLDRNRTRGYGTLDKKGKAEDSVIEFFETGWSAIEKKLETKGKGKPVGSYFLFGYYLRLMERILSEIELRGHGGTLLLVPGDAASIQQLEGLLRFNHRFSSRTYNGWNQFRELISLLSLWRNTLQVGKRIDGKNQAAERAKAEAGRRNRAAEMAKAEADAGKAAQAKVAKALAKADKAQVKADKARQSRFNLKTLMKGLNRSYKRANFDDDALYEEARPDRGGDSFEDKFKAIASLQARQESIAANISRFVATVSGIDGAVVMDDRFNVIGYGAEIKGEFESTPSHVWVVDSEGANPPVPRPFDLYGNRHRSVFRFCWHRPRSIAFVMSVDGGVKAVRRIKDESGKCQSDDSCIHQESDKEECRKARSKGGEGDKIFMWMDVVRPSQFGL